MPQEKTQSSGTTKKPAKATPAGGYTSSDSDVMGSSDNSSSSDSEASHVSQVEDQVAPPVADDDTQGGKDSKRRRMSSKGPVEKFDQVGKNKNEQEINVAVPKAKGSAKGKTSGRRKKVTAPTGADEHEKPKEGTMVTSVDGTDVENESDCVFSEVELPSPTIEENLVRSSVPSCLKYRHRRLSLSAVPMLLCLTLFACANGSFSAPSQLELTPSFAFSVEGRVAGMSAGGGGRAVLRREVSSDSYYSSYSSSRSVHGRSPVRRERSRSRSASTTVDMDHPRSERNKEIMEKFEKKNANKLQTNPEEAMKAALDEEIGMHVGKRLDAKSQMDAGTCALMAATHRMAPALSDRYAPVTPGQVDVPASVLTKLQTSMSKIGPSTQPDAAMNLIATGLGVKTEVEEDDKDIEAPTKVDILIADLEEITGSGRMTSRHRLQKTMMRELTEQKKSEYHALKGKHDLLEAFRLEWAEKKLAASEKSREHVKALSKKAEMVGVHLPIGVIVRKEGGWKDESAVRAAVTRVLKCIALAGKYVKWNGMTERWEFWLSRDFVSDSLEKLWAEKTLMTEKREKTATGSSLSNASAPTAKVVRACIQRMERTSA